MLSTLTVQEPLRLTLGLRSLRSLQPSQSLPSCTKTASFPRCYGPQFIARDFKEFIRIAGMTHVRTSPYYPQSNGKLERWHKSLKSECIRPGTPLTREDALRLIQTYVDHYNTARLHSAIGYVTPHDMLVGRQAEIHAARDRKLEEARHQRQLRRAAVSTPAHSSNATTMTSTGATEAGSARMQPC